jgi:hypothetical protein
MGGGTDNNQLKVAAEERAQEGAVVGQLVPIGNRGKWQRGGRGGGNGINCSNERITKVIVVRMSLEGQ